MEIIILCNKSTINICLFIANNNIGPAGVSEIAHALESNNSITNVDLSI